MKHRSFAAFFVASLALPPAFAQEAADPPSASEEPKSPPAYVVYPDAPASMTDMVTVEGEAVHFRAEAGTIAISADEREPAARLFYISYTRVHPETGEAAPAAERPITFSFNGGPGSSSVWLHLGLFGPYRVRYADDFGLPSAPPYGLVPNDVSLLDLSDFVFIDPVSTGFSRVEEGVEAGSYHGLEGDVEAVGAFIQQYLSRHKRWNSPKFIAGESYGTTRAAALTRHLWERHGVGLNGVMLISTVLNFQTLDFDVANDLSHVLFLPNFAATAQFHNKLAPDLQAMPVEALVAEVTAFATTDYATFLLRNAAADPALRERVVQALVRYTGLSRRYIEDVELRPGMPGFTKELLRDEGLTVGRLDSRFVGKDRTDDGGGPEFDPSYAAILGSYTAGLNELVRQRIGFETDLPYEILTGRVRPWSYGSAGNGQYVSVAERLRGAMEQQPALRVYNAAGYYDLATTQAAADYTLARDFGDPAIAARIMRRYYPAGHMMYLHRPSLEAQRRDLVEFYRSCLPRP